MCASDGSSQIQHLLYGSMYMYGHCAIRTWYSPGGLLSDMYLIASVKHSAAFSHTSFTSCHMHTSVAYVLCTRNWYQCSSNKLVTFALYSGFSEVLILHLKNQEGLEDYVM